MNLLLLLSALLSALSGVGGSVRAPQAAVAVGVAQVRVAEARVRGVVMRPVADAPVMVRVVAMSAAPLVAREPIWAGRRRE